MVTLSNNHKQGKKDMDILTSFDDLELPKSNDPDIEPEEIEVEPIEPAIGDVPLEEPEFQNIDFTSSRGFFNEKNLQSWRVSGYGRTPKNLDHFGPYYGPYVGLNIEIHGEDLGSHIYIAYDETGFPYLKGMDELRNFEDMAEGLLTLIEEIRTVAESQLQDFMETKTRQDQTNSK
jgi:hypothetical protein